MAFVLRQQAGKSLAGIKINLLNLVLVDNRGIDTEIGGNKCPLPEAESGGEGNFCRPVFEVANLLMGFTHQAPELMGVNPGVLKAEVSSLDHQVLLAVKRRKPFIHGPSHPGEEGVETRTSLFSGAVRPKRSLNFSLEDLAVGRTDQ